MKKYFLNIIILTTMMSVIFFITDDLEVKAMEYTDDILNDITSIKSNHNQNFGMGFIPISDDVDESDLISSSALTAPAQWDWRDYNGEDWTSIPKNQASCGSCWDFAAHSVLESIINIVEGDSTLDLDLSEQYILSCYSGGWGCGGSNAFYAFEYMHNNGGTIPESCFPYAANDARLCNLKCEDWQDKLVPITGFGYSTTHSIEDIKNKIVNEGPVALSFNVYSDFYDGSPSFDENGVYWHQSGTYQAGHQIAAVGYVDTPGNPNYDGYWILKNSWGSTWGPWDNGFYGMAYSDSNIDADVVWVEYESSAPDTIIINGPSGTIYDDDVVFELTGIDGDTPTSDLLYSYILEGYDTEWSMWTSDVTVQYNDLLNGQYIFKVKSKDESGIPDYTPATSTFTIDNKLAYTPTVFDFGNIVEGSSDSTSFSIWNIGTGELIYSLSESCDWLDVSPLNGESSGEIDNINVYVDAASLTEGTYQCDIDISSNGGNGIFSIYLNVVAVGSEIIDQEQTVYIKDFSIYDIRLGSQSFIPNLDIITRVELYLKKVGNPSNDFIFTIRAELSGPNLATLNIPKIDVPLSYDWVSFDFDDVEVTPGETYYIVVMTSGGSFYNCYNLGYSNGDPYSNGLLWYSRNSGSSWMELSLNDLCFKIYGKINAPPEPFLSFDPSSYDFGSLFEGVTSSTSFDVWNSGTGDLSYSFSESCGWVDVSPVSGISSGEHDVISVDVDATGLSVGSYQCDIVISSDGGSGVFSVFVNVIPPSPILSFDPSSYDFGSLFEGVT
ncbi:C1 family peptidase, partial [Thermoplasmatota archaeon]